MIPNNFSVFLVIHIFLPPFFLQEMLMVDFSQQTRRDFMHLSFGFQVLSPVRLRCSVVWAPTPVCRDPGCVMGSGTVRMEAMNSPQRAVVWTRWGCVCVGKRLRILKHLLLDCSESHISLTFSLPGLTGSVRTNEVGCSSEQFSKPSDSCKAIQTCTIGFRIFK